MAPHRKRNEHKMHFLKRLGRWLTNKIHRVRNQGKRGVKARKRRENVRKKIEFLKDKKDSNPARSGVGTFDGKQVAAWIIPWLERSRKAGWRGTVNSGYRSPEYSEQLCRAMCGAPSCPGRCAGRASNHAGKDYPEGAVDVSDYENFERIQPRIGSPLCNRLDYRDPVHFSVSGH